jgi:hypothetical protein
MNHYEAIGRKAVLTDDRRRYHAELQALAQQVARLAVDFRLTTGQPPLAGRVAEAQDLLKRCAELAAELADIDRQLLDLPA